MKEHFYFGETVKGYEIPVLNGREARAGAGILLLPAMTSFLVSFLTHDFRFTKIFVTVFMVDFFIRVFINPKYAPSLILGRIFIQNQTPEYVGAAQKRFAWMIGLALAIPMFYLLVLNTQPNPLKPIICSICLLLLIFESAFSICLGCKIYNLIMPEKASHCPGGVCDVRKKEKIQTFNIAQKIIFLLTVLVMFTASYAYMYKLENKTMIGKMLSEKMMSDEKRKAIADAVYLKALEDFDNDDDFD